MNGALRKGSIPATGFRPEMLAGSKVQEPRQAQASSIAQGARVTACLSLKP